MHHAGSCHGFIVRKAFCFDPGYLSFHS
uniref:Uncharacterized protein n=1 Tax=Anguilla anguilla TaxID=7936 RepID=A0A0E9RPU6_ANGAN